MSIDGFRPDYLDRAGESGAPFLTSMARRGAVSRELIPTYPSLTFSVHASEVTGASAGVHGVPGNSFYDRSLGEQFSFPQRADLLKAEAIWTSATRQGLRVAVFDWPFSNGQTGPHMAAYFAERYDNQMTDEQRGERLIETMRSDDGAEKGTPLSLVMGYADAVDKAGHAVGPAHPGVVEQLSRLDKVLADVHAEAMKYVIERCPPGTRLYFLVSTDHGMLPVVHLANLNQMAGEAMPAGARTITGGATGHVFVPDGPEKAGQVAALAAELGRHRFARVYTHATLPARWRMLDPDRVGDVYVDLMPGYTFSSRPRTPSVSLRDLPATRPTDRGPLGMHSWDPAEVPQMNGIVLVSRYPSDFGGRDVGPVDARRLAATVSSWLGVEPPAQAEVGPVRRLVR
ncbi:MAG: alkaline phosphatase family protein [Verrucomicrobiae bacterium]|nr:alkaline phosphatase family protein [Verrucomicrobiae bacterium]